MNASFMISLVVFNLQEFEFFVVPYGKSTSCPKISGERCSNSQSQT